MRSLLLLSLLAACGSSSGTGDQVDAAVDTFQGTDDTLPDAAGLFGDLSGMCGVITDTELTEASPSLVQDRYNFARAYMDPADRTMLTSDGMRLIATPNAGGSSGISELFAFEQLARCEGATLLKTETEVQYTNMNGKRTDLLVMLHGMKVGVSVTRAFAFPLGQPYSEAQASELLTRKLTDITASTANVTAADAWHKQILAYQAIDDQAAGEVLTVWNGLDATTKSDTILLITTTDGTDTFMYQNQ
ncbi:MAG TPA: hypothetical protein VGM90_05465 [Kofleriaceae bacterium]|jgi:hypothetical protein